MKKLDLNKEYETEEKVGKKWVFVGRDVPYDEKFEIDTKEKTIKGNKYIYKTYKYLNGRISEVRYFIGKEGKNITKIKNWEIQESKDELNKNVYVVYEELASNENEDLIKYYDSIFMTLSDALHYIAERIGE